MDQDVFHSYFILQRQKDNGWPTSGLCHYMFFRVLLVTGTLSLPEEESSALRKCKSIHIFWLAQTIITFSHSNSAVTPPGITQGRKKGDQPAYLCGLVEEGTYVVR